VIAYQISVVFWCFVYFDSLSSNALHICATQGMAGITQITLELQPLESSFDDPIDALLKNGPSKSENQRSATSKEVWEYLNGSTDPSEPPQGTDERSKQPAIPHIAPAADLMNLASSGKKDVGSHDQWTYRAYQPILPCANKLLQHKWDEVTQRDHAEKIKRAKKTIDTTAPKQYSHLVSQHRKMRVKMGMHIIVVFWNCQTYDPNTTFLQSCLPLQPLPTSDEASKLYLENKLLLQRIKHQISTVPKPPTSPAPGDGSNRPRAIQPDPVIQTHGLNGPRKRMLKVQTEYENEVY
jgi:hypothetical protein